MDISLYDIDAPLPAAASRAQRLFNLGYKDDYYEEFISLLHEYLESIFSELNSGRKELQNDSEDRLSRDIISTLSVCGFLATHGTATGGHCDIFIAFRDAKWIGEAKKIDSNQQAYIKQGLLQLTERYASGMKFQTNGAIIIYCFAPNAQKVLNDLSAKLANDDYEVEDKLHPDDLHFRASKKHTGTGNTYSVTSYIIPLHHDPVI